jgi:hypothetical protein
MKPTSKEVINELSKILDATPKKINGFMTPKEKARELVSKYFYYFPEFYNDKEYGYNEDKAKECALIAVDMVIKCCKDYDEVHENYTTQVDHWMEVKREIEKL